MSLATWICYPSLLWQVTIIFSFPLSLSLCPKLSLHLGSFHDPSLPKSNITAERDWQKSLFPLPFLLSVTYNMIKCHVMSRWTSFEPKRPSSKNFIENFSTKWPRQSAKVSPLFSISVRESHKDLSCCSAEIRAPTPTPVVSPLHPRADRNTPFICPLQENHPHLDSSGLQSWKEAMEWVSHRAEQCLTPLPTREVPVQHLRGSSCLWGGMQRKKWQADQEEMLPRSVRQDEAEQIWGRRERGAKQSHFYLQCPFSFCQSVTRILTGQRHEKKTVIWIIKDMWGKLVWPDKWNPPEALPDEFMMANEVAMAWCA